MHDMFTMLQQNLPIAVIVLLLSALIYIWKDARTRERELVDKQIDLLKEVVPLTIRVTEAVSVLERITDTIAKMGKSP